MKTDIKSLFFYVLLMSDVYCYGSNPTQGDDLEAVFSCYTSNPYAQSYGVEENKLERLKQKEISLRQKGGPCDELKQLQIQIGESQERLNGLGLLARNY